MNTGFEADLAQQVEHIHGKDGVSGSSPEVGSSNGKGLRHYSGTLGFFTYEIRMQIRSILWKTLWMGKEPEGHGALLLMSGGGSRRQRSSMAVREKTSRVGPSAAICPSCRTMVRGQISRIMSRSWVAIRRV